MKNKFYLRSPHGNTGSNMVFHAIDGKGYTSNLDLAHVYTLEEAQKEWELARDGEYPISADHIDSLSSWKVDHQYLPSKSDLSPSDKYMFFVKGMWDGNDVYWTDLNGNKSTNFLHAQIIGRTAAECINHNDYVVVPFELADKKKRRTFNFALLNHRKMMIAAGLRTPERIKKARRRVINPMTRFNCPTCGKINWQHNPYDFDGCKHCDEGMRISFQWGVA